MDAMPDVSRFFHPVLASEKLKRNPVRIEIAGHPYVLFREADGRAAALVDRCPHRFAPLSKGRVRPDGRLACGYHGWHFDGEGHGVSPSQPILAKCDVRSLQVVERLGYIWLASRETPISEFPAMEWDDYGFGGSFDYLFQAPIHVALANFSEDEHTPFVHTRLGWDEAHVSQIEFEAQNFDDRSEVLYRAPQRPSPYILLMGLRGGDTFRNEWVTRFDPLRTLYTISWSHRKSGERRPLTLRVMIFMTPETEKTSRFHVFIFIKSTSRLMNLLMPLVKKAAMLLTWYEVDDDARFSRHLGDTPVEMKEMRLGKFDKPVIHNNKLLQTIYLREENLHGVNAKAVQKVQEFARGTPKAEARP